MITIKSRRSVVCFVMYLCGVVWLFGASPIDTVGQTDTLTPDVFASATALIEGATQTAEADTQGLAPVALTATVIIRDITATAVQSTGATAQPLPTQPASALSIDEAFELTATRYIADVTATAEAFPIADEDIEEVGLLTFLLAIGSMAIVFVLLIGVVVFMNKQRWSGEAPRRPKEEMHNRADD